MTSSPAKGNKPESGSVLFMEIVVNRVLSIVCPQREKILNLHQKYEKSSN
jgi:hypothetical protein